MRVLEIPSSETRSVAQGKSWHRKGGYNLSVRVPPGSAVLVAAFGNMWGFEQRLHTCLGVVTVGLLDAGNRTFSPVIPLPCCSLQTACSNEQ